MNESSKAPATLEDRPEVSQSSRGAVMSLLGEIEALLEKLVASGEQGTIDIQALPLDRQALEDCLGSGDVEANVEALGRTHVRETAISGVWWVTHYNMSSDIVAETIEVCEAPEILRADPAELQFGLKRVRSVRAEMDATA